MTSPTAATTFTGHWDAIPLTVVICTALSLYNALELLLLIFTSFHRWRGLYFWSLLIASIGVIPYCVGFLITYFRLSYVALGEAISSVGWSAMITGQSFVLYSRLGLILDNQRILRGVLWMIIIDAIVFHSTTTVLLFGAHGGKRQETFGLGYFYVEKIQMTAFCIQEFIISGIYVWKTTQLLKIVSKKGTRRLMWQLFTINVIVIIFDIALLTIEYKDLHVMEQTVKSFIYSVKLKLEFAILGKLVDLVQRGKRTLSQTILDTADFVDETKSPSSIARVASVDSRPEWMHDLEKVAPVQRVEGNGSVQQPDLGDAPALTRAQTVASSRRTRRDSSLMYAEAMRSISSA